MIGLLKKLAAFSPLSMLPPLETYDIAKQPKGKPVVVAKADKSTTADVRNGAEWKTEWDGQGNSVSEKVGTKIPDTAGGVTLDRFDLAYLDDVLGAEWRREESKAKVLKWHWLKEMSAAKIQAYHTTRDGKLQKGFSERTVAAYIKAFFAADDAREADNTPRLRPER